MIIHFIIFLHYLHIFFTYIQDKIFLKAFFSDYIFLTFIKYFSNREKHHLPYIKMGFTIILNKSIYISLNVSGKELQKKSSSFSILN